MPDRPDIRFKVKGIFLECLTRLIDMLVKELNDPSDEGKLLMATLWEVRKKISVKLASEFRNEYKITLTPSQSIALRLLYTGISFESDPWFMNELRKISDHVHRQYAF